MAKRAIEVKLRPYEPSDIAAMTALLNMPKVIEGTLQLPQRSLAERERKREGFTPIVDLVAEVGGLVVGHTALHLAEPHRRRHTGAVGLAVRDDFHRQGIGEMLLRALLEQADDWLGLRRVELIVHADNAGAIALYEKLGFAPEGILRDYVLTRGQYRDALMMARLNRGQTAAR